MLFLGLEGVLSLTGFPIHTHTPNCVRIRKILAHGTVKLRVLYRWWITGWRFSPQQAVCSLRSDSGLLMIEANIPLHLFPPVRCGGGCLMDLQDSLTGLLSHRYTRKEAWVELPPPSPTSSTKAQPGLVTPTGWLASVLRRKRALPFGESGR